MTKYLIILPLFLSFLSLDMSAQEFLELEPETQSDNQVLNTKMDAVRRSPKDAKKWLDLGSYLASLNRHEEAVKSFERKVLRASHYRYIARYYAAKSAYLSGDKKKSWDLFRKLARDNKTPGRIRVATDYFVKKHWPLNKRNTLPKDLPISYILAPHYSSINYDDDNDKSSGEALGLYFSRYNFKTLWEFDFSRTSTNLGSSGALENFTQTDLSIAYSRFADLKKQFRGGLHLILASDSSLNGGFTLFWGLTKHNFEKGRFSLTGYYTRLSNEFNSSAAFQLTPYIHYFENKLNFTLIGHMIRTSGVESSSTYETNGLLFSAEFELSYHFDAFIPAVGIYGGNQIHVVKGDGFVINQVPDLYSFGNYLALTYKITRENYAKIQLSNNTFQAFNKVDNSSSSSVNLSFKFTF